MKNLRILLLLCLGGFAAAQNPNLSSTTPAAPSGGVNCLFQYSGVNVSCYIPSGTYDPANAAATALTSAETFSGNAANLTNGTIPVARLPLATSAAAGAVICGTGTSCASGVMSVTAGGDALDDAGTINSLTDLEYLNTTHPPLAYWDAAYHNCQNQVVNVVVHGDSRSIVDTTVASGAGATIAVTFAGRWSNLLKTKLQRDCGSHGTGLVPFKYGAGVQIFNADYYTVSNSSWTVDTSIGPYQGGSIADGMTVLTTAALTITFIPGTAFDHLNCYGVNYTGLNAWTMNIDGNAVGTCGGGTDSTKTAVLATSSAVSLGTHTVTLVCATSPCEAYGMEATAGTTGVSVHDLSVGSGAAELFGLAPSTQYAFSDLIPGNQALDIIYEIANEPGVGYSTTQFTTTLGNMITHDRALAYPPSVMIFSPLQDGISGQTPYYPILKSTAQTYSTAFADLRDRWGQSLVSFLFGPDTYHENNIGNAEVYSAIAGTVIDTAIPSPTSPGVANISCPTGYSVSSITNGVASCAVNMPPVYCGAGYAHSVALTVASSSVSGGSSLANFPALLGFNGATTGSITLTNLATTANGGQVQNSAGADITFCTAQASGTTLPFEQVSYTATSGAAEYYVSIPTLSASASTTIYAFWDNATASSSAAPAIVWQNANYAAVYHFGTSASLGLTDSSGNANTLTNSGATVTAGEFGGAALMTSAEHLLATAAIGLPTGSEPRTIEAWVKFTTAPTTDSIMFGYGNGAAGDGAFAIDSNASSPDLTGAWEVDTANRGTFTPDANWHQYVGVLPTGQTTGGGLLSYVDGALLSGLECSVSTPPSYCSDALTTSGGDLTINGEPGADSDASVGETIDELRVSTVGRSSGWIATQYANQSNPSTFFTLGTIN